MALTRTPGEIGTSNSKRLSAGRLRALGYESYRDYINGGHWKRTRDAYYADPTTEKVCLCGSHVDLQLHHMTYERVGAERLDDLRPLCPRCHAAIHVLERRGDVRLDLRDYASDLRRARYIRERRTALARRGEADAEGHDDEPFSPHQSAFNAELRRVQAHMDAGKRSRPPGVRQPHRRRRVA